MAEKDTVEPWERQEDEGSKAYEAFCIYRDMGIERTIRKVANVLSKSNQLIKRWSYTHQWVKRAGAWDAEQDRITRIQQTKEIQAMRKKQRKTAERMQDVGQEMLERLHEKVLATGRVQLGDVVSLLKIGMEQERICRGDVGEVIEERDGGAAPTPVTFYMPDNGRDKKEGE